MRKKKLLTVTFLMQCLTFAHVESAEGGNTQVTPTNQQDASERPSWSNLPMEVKKNIIGFLTDTTVKDTRALKSLEQVSHADQEAVKEFGDIYPKIIDEYQDKISDIENYFSRIRDKLNKEASKSVEKIEDKIIALNSREARKFPESRLRRIYETGFYKHPEFLGMNKSEIEEFTQKGEEIIREEAILMEKFPLADEVLIKRKNAFVKLTYMYSLGDELREAKKTLALIKEINNQRKLNPELDKKINQLSDRLEKFIKNKDESNKINSEYKEPIYNSKNLVELQELEEERIKKHQERDIPIFDDSYIKRVNFLNTEIKEFVIEEADKLEKKYSKLKELGEFYRKEFFKVTEKKEEIERLHRRALVERMSSDFIKKIKDQRGQIEIKQEEIAKFGAIISFLRQCIEKDKESHPWNYKGTVRLKSLSYVKKVEEELQEEGSSLEPKEVVFPDINFLKQELEEHIARKYAVKEEVGASSAVSSSHSEIGKTHAPLGAEEHDQYKNIGNEIEIKVEKIDEHAREHEHPSVSEHAAHNSEHLHE